MAFILRLALQFGMPVGEMLDRMTGAELDLWAEFYDQEPWGYQVENWRMGQVCSTAANAAGGKKNGKPFHPKDFMPRRKPAGPVTIPESLPEWARARFLEKYRDG